MQPYFAAYVRATTGWRSELERGGNASYIVWINCIMGRGEDPR